MGRDRGISDTLPIDHQDLIYGACILKHSIHGTEFPDLAWLVPDDLASPKDIQPTLIAVSTIALADTLVKWLCTQLKAFITQERGLVFPFHSIIPQEEHICHEPCTATAHRHPTLLRTDPFETVIECTATDHMIFSRCIYTSFHGNLLPLA